MKKILVLGGAGAMANETTRDLVETSDFSEITVAEIDRQKALDLVAQLKDRRLKVTEFNAESISEMSKIMEDCDVVANGLPRIFAKNAIIAAINAKKDILDLTSPHRETLGLDTKAKAAGITAVGGVGITPGITNILARLGADRLDSIEQIDIDFAAFRSIAHSPALLHVILWEFDPRTNNRYCFENGKLVPNAPFSGERIVHFPKPIGTQATYYVPHGESQTLSKNIRGVKRVYIRGCFPPMAMRLVRAIYDYGLYKQKAVSLFELLKAYLLEALEGDQAELWGYSVQVEVIGRLKARRVMKRFQTTHPPMEEWGGSRAYDKNVGIPLSIGAQLLGKGRAMKKGVDGVENMLPCKEFVEELKKRGFVISEELIDLKKSRRAASG